MPSRLVLPRVCRAPGRLSVVGMARGDFDDFANDLVVPTGDLGLHRRAPGHRTGSKPEAQQKAMVVSAEAAHEKRLVTGTQDSSR